MLNLFLGGFTSWKTTLAASIAAAAVLLKNFGVIDIPAEAQTTIVAFALLVLGWVAKDSGATGTPNGE